MNPTGIFLTLFPKCSIKFPRNELRVSSETSLLLLLSGFFFLYTESNTPATLQTMEIKQFGQMRRKEEIKQFGQMRRKEGSGRRANTPATLQTMEIQQFGQMRRKEGEEGPTLLGK
jgi:hypothetical protein